MTSRPSLLIFDVNETLSDLAPMAQRFDEVGAPGHLAKTWFAGLLRDGFALSVNGDNPAFADLAKDGLRGLLTGLPLDRDVDDAVEHVMSGVLELDVHPDVTDGVPTLADRGFRLATLSNGSASIAKALLKKADLTHHFEHLLSVEDAGAWKPAGQAYAYALETCGVAATDAMLVAVHPWDLDGARRAGLQTAWINRSGGPYPSSFASPTIAASSVDDLADQLALKLSGLLDQ